MTPRKKRQARGELRGSEANPGHPQASDPVVEGVLELLLKGERSAGTPATRESGTKATELRQAPTDNDELEATRALLQRARALNCRSDWSTKRERRLIQQVLRNTTRLDPSWKGDLHLVLGFVRESISRSSQLRTAAALLFVQCFVVLPAVAWIVLQPKPVDPYFNTGIEPRPDAMPEADTEQIELELPADLLSPDAEQHLLDRKDNTRRQARFLLLTQVGLSLPRGASNPGLASGIESGLKSGAADAQPDLPFEALLFEERSRLMQGAGVKYSLRSLERWVKTPAQRNLLALLALDRGLILGRSEDLGRILNGLALEESAGSADALALHVLARARAQGDWPQAPPQGWGEQGPRVVLPLGQGEEEALEAVFGEQLDSFRDR